MAVSREKRALHLALSDFRTYLHSYSVGPDLWLSVWSCFCPVSCRPIVDANNEGFGDCVYPEHSLFT